MIEFYPLKSQMRDIFRNWQNEFNKKVNACLIVAKKNTS